MDGEPSMERFLLGVLARWVLWNIGLGVPLVVSALIVEQHISDPLWEFLAVGACVLIYAPIMIVGTVRSILKWDARNS